MADYTHISGVDVDKETKAIMAAFLSAYFDGAAHAIGGNDPVVFDKAAIAFDQGAIKQPLDIVGDGVEIRVLFDPGSTERFANADGWDVLQRCMFQFWVRGKVVTASAQRNSKSLAQTSADRLFDLFNNPLATQDLAAAGITQFRPRKQQTRQNADYATRLVVCPCKLVYQTTF